MENTKNITGILSQRRIFKKIITKNINHADNIDKKAYTCYTTYGKQIILYIIFPFKTLSLYLQQFQLSKSLEAGRT